MNTPLIAICSDEELKEVAEQWCDLVGEKPTNETLNAFMMGAKLALSNNGWINKTKDESSNNRCERI
jgi:hypothetical protein